MTRHYRVSVGRTAAFPSDALAGGFVGTSWMPDVNLAGQFPDVSYMRYEVKFRLIEG